MRANTRPRTMALLERARAHMPNGVPMAWMATDNEVPVYIERGEGAGFMDVDGHRDLDVNVDDMRARRASMRSGRFP